MLLCQKQTTTPWGSIQSSSSRLIGLLRTMHRKQLLLFSSIISFCWFVGKAKEVNNHLEAIVHLTAHAVKATSRIEGANGSLSEKERDT